MMSRGARATRWAGIAATTLLVTTALAADPPEGPPAPRAAKKGTAKVPEPDLPDPEVRVTLVAPSAQAPWTLRIENAGAFPVRVPADVRLLRFTLEPGDTMARQPGKPVTCAAPAGMRGEGFPDRNALLLAPGDAYVETFDPRLFCFGKDAKLLAGSTLVRARYGWDGPKGAKKPDPPFVVQSTAFPAEVSPVKQIVAPALVLSYLPPDIDEPAPVVDPKPAEAPSDGASHEGHEGDDPPATGDSAHLVDENGARLELKSAPWADAGQGYNVALAITVTNVGHRAAMAAIRSRAFGFHIDGPGGAFRCGPGAAARAIPRDGFQALRPGGSVSMTVLVEEACGRELFRRPGLYRVTPLLQLNESGTEVGLAALTGTVRAKEATLVRVATGPEQFYPSPPKAIRAPKVDPSPSP